MSGFADGGWMVALEEVDDVLSRYHQALSDFFKGDPEPAKPLFSHQDDVTLANPFGPAARGWQQVEETMDRAASHYSDGGVTGFEEVARYVTAELAYIHEVERAYAKVDGSDDVTSLALRVTSIFRPEDGTWKVVHRHADPITTSRPGGSVIQS
jgi:ketosteroid isomerase-like protein